MIVALLCFPLPTAFDFSVSHSALRFILCEPEIFSVVQHSPRQSCVLGCDGYDGLPVPTSRNELTRPATEAILLVAQRSEYRASAKHKQTAQIGVSGLGDKSFTAGC